MLKNGPAPLLEPYPGAAERERLHIAFAVPTFNIGSGGHNIIFQIMLRLEQMGHICSIWIHDLFGHRPQDGPALLQREIRESFAPVKAPVFREFDRWYGADVVVATAWQTVYPVLELDGVRARAYLINDHEPEFFATSVESEFARRTYSLGLYGIAGSPWLRDLYVDRYGGEAGMFQYGVDHDVYFPRPIERRRDTVVAYARAVTPRRAVGLVVPALEELRRRRPDVRIVLFGDKQSDLHAVRLRARGRGQPRGALVAVLGGDGGALPVAHQLLADPAGDARLWTALCGPRPAQHALGVRRRRAGQARGLRPRSDR